MYHKVPLINLLPMIPQSLGKMLLFGLSERVEHNRRAQERFRADKAYKFFHTFPR